MRPAQLTAATVLEWLGEGRRVAAGLLVGIDGSAPLDVGASMYVDADGTIEGSVTGGCVESAVAQEAMALLEAGGPARLVTYGISDDLAGTVGLMCGGTVHILVHELDAASREATEAGLAAFVEGRPSAVATLLDGPTAGAKLYVDAERRVGSLGGPELLDANVEREARGLVAHGRTAVRHFGEDGATLGTGLRVQELASLTPAAFDLEARTVTVCAASTKNRKRAVQPLPAAVNDLMRRHLAGRASQERIWPGTWWKRTAKLIRRDLAAAGVPYVVEGEDGPLYADFHALRHTYVTEVVRTAPNLKVAQELARHSTPALTLGVYTHSDAPERRAAVDGLFGAVLGEMPGPVIAPAAPVDRADAPPPGRAAG